MDEECGVAVEEQMLQRVGCGGWEEFDVVVGGSWKIGFDKMKFGFSN